MNHCTAVNILDMVNAIIGRKACPDFIDGYDIAPILRNLNIVRFEALYKVSGGYPR